MRVSALRLHSRCCAFSCMADRVDSSMSVSFSTCWYFPRACVQTEQKRWERVGPSPPTPTPVTFQCIRFPSKCSHMLRFTHLWKQRRHKHTDDDLASHSKNMEPAATAEIHRGRIPSVCPCWTVSACSSAMFLWKTWLSCWHASWKIRHHTKSKTTKYHDNNRDSHTATLQTDEVQDFYCEAPHRTFAKMQYSWFHVS